jgi:hypothetical protein
MVAAGGASASPIYTPIVQKFSANGQSEDFSRTGEDYQFVWSRE